MKRLPKNGYGQVDVRGGAPKGLVHIRGKRLTVTCRAIGVDCAPAIFGWTTGKWKQPILDGVVVRAGDESRVREAIAARDSRGPTPEQRERRRQRQQDRDTAAFAEAIRAEFPGMPEDDVSDCAQHTTEIGSRRVGRSQVADNPVRAAVVAYARHNYTDYEERLDRGEDRDDARANIYQEVRALLFQWAAPHSPLDTTCTQNIEHPILKEASNGQGT